MNCYNHTEINAVSSCGKCNKSLCKNCYDLGFNGLCSDCFVKRENLKVFTKREDHKENVRKSNVAVIVGALIGLFISSLVFSDPDVSNLVGVSIIVIYAYAAFSLYWGLKVCSQLFNSILNMGVLLIFTWPLLMFILTFALFIGFFVSIPKFNVSYRESKKIKNYNKPTIKY